MSRSRIALRRKRVGLSQERLAQAVGVSTTTIANWETGVHAPLDRYRPKLARALQLADTELAMLLGEADDTEAATFAVNGAVPEWLSLFAKAEQAASHVLVFEPIVVPALLQTRAYASAVEVLGHVDISELTRSRRVDTRMARQAALDRDPDPLFLFAVIDESVLSRPIGGPDVMADQLNNLLRAGARPNISIRVVTGTAVAAAWFGPFSLLSMGTTAAPDVACTDTLAAPSYLEGPGDVRNYAALFEHLVEVALSAEESTDLINDHRERYR